MNALEKNLLYDGSPNPPAEPQIFRAGPVTVAYAGGDIRYVRLGSHEILRRVYAAVRDHNWTTIIPRIEHEVIEQTADSFRVTFVAEHQQGDIDFHGHGSISGAADGTITFTFDGEARSTFRRNRVGFCVLHPDSCAGQPCIVLHTDGSVEDSQFPLYISAHQPIFDIRSIMQEIEPGVRAEVVMEGDTFEMEDQRNWTDASYKTYCTPLAIPYPATVERGTKISQSITVRLHSEVSEAPRHEGEGFGVRALSPSPTLTITNQTLPLPAIGLFKSRVIHHGEYHYLMALNLAHMRLDLHMRQLEWKKMLEYTIREVHLLGVGLEIALYLSDAAENELSELRAALDELKPLVERWLIFHIGEKSTSEKWVRLAREKLGDYGAPIGTGTDYFFTELNRERPPVEHADFITYSLNPQVHAFENVDLIETLPVQGATVTSAKQFSAGKPVIVSPVTLHMRNNPNATGPQSEPEPEARQKTLFGAAWTVGSIKSLAEAGAHSVTYYEASGAGGVMADSVFPMYHVFADVGEFAGGEALVCQSSDPLAFDGLVLRKDGRTRVLLANYTRQTQTISLPDVRGAVAIKRLDETTVQRYAEADAARVEAGADGLRVELLPYGVVRIDY
jgi:hypothetical protein